VAQQEEFVFRRDLAKQLGVSGRTLRNWERDQHLPPSRKIGPKLRGWLKSEIATFLDKESPR
jgi:predicted DNA-binding transcriptional regulator AlpA